MYTRSRLHDARVVLVILFWYTISSTTILTTKWVLSEKDGTAEQRILFPFPLTVTTFSNTLTTLLAFLMSRHRRFRPPPVTAAQLKRYILPIGLVTAFDIGCSNVALKILTVSFGTIIKGSAPVFTMLWGLVFGIERYSTSVFLSLVTISSGIALASLGEGSSFVLVGFLLQLVATSLAGLRWAMTQVLLKGHGDPLSPVAAVLYTSPATALFIAPFAAVIEGPSIVRHLAGLEHIDVYKLICLLTLIGTLVFLLLVSEYWLVNDTSSLALSVAAVFKELLTIGGGILIFGEVITVLKVAGFVICQAGLSAYVYLRSKMDDSSPRPSFELSDLETPLAENDADENPWDEELSPMPLVRAHSR